MTTATRSAERSSAGASALIVIVGSRACAIPSRHVRETMRPLPIVPLAGVGDAAREFVLGIAVIRGAAVPVVDVRRLLAEPGTSTAPRRFVTVAVEDRPVALAVDEVIGLRQLELARLQELPPLLRGASAEIIEAIGIVDAQLLVLLRTARLVPDDVWAVLAVGAP